MRESKKGTSPSPRERKPQTSTRSTSTRSTSERAPSNPKPFSKDAKPARSFGNKKSMFLSKEEREVINTPKKEPSKNAVRHLDPQARIDDRARSSASLSKDRIAKKLASPTKKTFTPSHRPGSNERRRMASSLKKDDREGDRLNKFIAHSGVCSRRDADMYIRSGSVEVNGVVVTEMGYKVLLTDVVKFDGVELKTEKKVYVLLNKPKNFITTTDDPEKRRTVMELVKNATKERIYPVGRLDRSTMGLLLFTNDGEIAKRITHPSSNIKKIYHATLDRSLTANDMGRIREGIELEDGPISVDSISYIPGEAHRELGIELHSGKNRIVRRIFEHLGYEVVKLDRVQLGPLTKKNLTRGQWRLLTKEEVNMLMMTNKSE